MQRASRPSEMYDWKILAVLGAGVGFVCHVQFHHDEANGFDGVEGVASDVGGDGGAGEVEEEEFVEI